MIPGVWVETLKSPRLYTTQQLDRACQVAGFLGRGKFVLLEPPKR